ncbi:hypothetical protein CXF61_03675 [Psychrobacter sp. 4Dc]|nr:hypothetical protein CXF61_03675 [Psychrobacter sp. 4Dc]
MTVWQVCLFDAFADMSNTIFIIKLYIIAQNNGMLGRSRDVASKPIPHHILFNKALPDRQA